jgi:type I restriction enzyme S subunit
MNWPLARISDFCRVKHGYAFKSRYFESDGPYVLFTPGSFNEEGGYRDQGDKTKYYTGDVPDGFILDEGDLLIAMTEQAPGLLGSSAWIPEPNRFLHNQRLGRIIDLDETRVEKRFLYYLFNTRGVRHQISASATGTKVRHTAPERIGRVLVPLPPRKVQSWIANTLSTYDDLIENNWRRMALLEEAARQLYREWFVRLRFPGHEHTRITNGVPEGWKWRRIGDIAECVGGGTPPTSVSAYWEGGDITWVTPTDVTRNQHHVLLDSEKKITEAGLQNSSARLVPPHAVLMTSRASVGFFAVAQREVCTNQGFICVVPTEEALSPYLLFHLSGRVEEIRSMGSGSTYPEVSRGKFREFEVLLSEMKLVSLFAEQAEMLLKQIRVLKQQNQKLRVARDLLLPRLMSGEIVI